MTDDYSASLLILDTDYTVSRLSPILPITRGRILGSNRLAGGTGLPSGTSILGGALLVVTFPLVMYVA